MILIDYNAIAIGNIVTQKLEVEENLIRHMILNSIRLYRKKFQKEYGEIVIVTDAGDNWRKEYFPEYKARRQTDREDSQPYWDEVFRIINLVRKELTDHFPYKVLTVWKCEADDLIHALAEHTQEFGQWEKVLIISSDGDFGQLQKWDNVQQFCPRKKTFIKEPDPQVVLFEHICRGDGGDGVPNILSPDRVFVENGRQNRLSSKKLSEWWELYKKDPSKGPEIFGEEVYRNFVRNKTVIDLSSIPTALKSEIINTYVNTVPAPKSKVIPFLVDKRCRILLECIGDFL